MSIEQQLIRRIAMLSKSKSSCKKSLVGLLNGMILTSGSFKGEYRNGTLVCDDGSVHSLNPNKISHFELRTLTILDDICSPPSVKILTLLNEIRTDFNFSDDELYEWLLDKVREDNVDEDLVMEF